MVRFGSFLLGALATAAVVAVLALTGVFDGTDPKGAAAGATARAGTGGISAAPAASVADIYERVSPGVVFVSARTGRGALPYLGPGGGRASSGSGFVVDPKGTIVTNQHVVDGASDVRVRFGEDGDPIRARIVGQDPSTDLAVLRIDPDDVEGGLKALALGESKTLRPGEATIALGAPFGLAGTVTTGIVSALDREIESPNGFPIAGVVQTDAAINPGNSGGPLLDSAGRVIGVNSQIATNGQSNANSGVGFAVPIDTVKEVVPLLERDGKVDRPYLGVSTSEPTGAADGALVRSVIPGGPSAKAGLRAGDRIVRVGDRAVRAPEDVAAAIAERKPGEKVAVRFVRGGGERTATVELGTRPTESRR
ncbi:MAG TPA: trypsin-like peptidase domain-containing protein [Solirubrobacteraceae bacterium]|jgi:S1-C subfamily serine protease